MIANRAIIVGGGVAGLSAALALVRIGWRPVVLERAGGFGDGGAGMQLSANAVRVIDALGPGRVVRTRATSVSSGLVRDGVSGRILVDFRLSGRRWGAPYLHIRRSDLIAAFVEVVGDIVVAGAPVRAVGQDSDSAWVDLDDGIRHTGDIVIGADGARSRIRTALWGSEHLVTRGDTARRRLVPVEAAGRWAPADGAVSIWVGARMHHVTYRVGEGQDASIVTVGEAGCDLEDFSGWHPAIGAMHGSPALVSGASKLVEVIGLHRWSKGRVVLVGDACHAMLPHLGQGAAMALEDAWVLARIISGHAGPVSQALSAFRGERVRRIVAVRRHSRRNRDLFHVGSRAGRCLAVAAMRAGLPLGALDWLYRHDVTSQVLQYQSDGSAA